MDHKVENWHESRNLSAPNVHVHIVHGAVVFVIDVSINFGIQIEALVALCFCPLREEMVKEYHLK